jgi:hypothetical protein
MKAVAVALALAASLPTFAAPRPDPTAEAKAHYKKGSEYYKQARYREAIAEFEAAYKLKPHGVMHFNIAQCYERLGDIPAALRSYHDYLREVPDADDKSSVLEAMANLEARLSATGVQQLLVYSEPSEAEVWIDGQSRGRTPLGVVLPHGTHVVSLVKEGYRSVTREAVLTTGRSVELAVTLQRGPAGAPGRAPVPPPLVAAPAPLPPPTAEGRVAATPAPPPDKVTVPPLSLSREGPKPVARKGHLWTWVAAGAAVAAAGAGAWMGASAKSDSDKLMSGSYTQPQVQQLHDSARSKARTANVLYGVAGAAGAAGVGLFFLEGSF